MYIDITINFELRTIEVTGKKMIQLSDINQVYQQYLINDTNSYLHLFYKSQTYTEWTGNY